MVCIIFICYFQYIIIIHGRDLQNRIKICFMFYNQPVPFGYRDRGEGTVTGYVTSTCCPYLNTHNNVIVSCGTYYWVPKLK